MFNVMYGYLFTVLYKLKFARNFLISGYFLLTFGSLCEGKIPGKAIALFCSLPLKNLQIYFK